MHKTTFVALVALVGIAWHLHRHHADLRRGEEVRAEQHQADMLSVIITEGRHNLHRVCAAGNPDVGTVLRGWSDRWGHDLRFTCWGPDAPYGVIARSAGPDGELDTDDDITSDEPAAHR